MTKSALWQEEMIQDLIALLKPEPAIRGLFTFGSCVSMEVGYDAWSDLDILMVVEESALARYYPQIDWVAPLGSVYAYEQSATAFTRTSRVCFSNLRRVDFVLTSERSLEQIADWPFVSFWKETCTLFSKSDLVNTILTQDFDPPPPPLISHEEFEKMLNQFWYRGIIAVTKVARNDLLIAMHLAAEMVQDCAVLGMLLRDRAEETSYHHSGGIGNEIITQLQDTQFPYTARGILDCIEQSGRVFDRLAGQWAGDYRPRRQLLLEWITRARKEIT